MSLLTTHGVEPFVNLALARAAEAAASSAEKGPGVDLAMGSSVVAAKDRPGFDDLSNTDRNWWPSGLHAATEGDQSICLVSADGKFGKPEPVKWLAADLSRSIEGTDLAGATNTQAIEQIRLAAENTDTAFGMLLQQNTRGKTPFAGSANNPSQPALSASAIRFFRGADGESKAVLFGAGSMRILHIRG